MSSGQTEEGTPGTSASEGSGLPQETQENILHVLGRLDSIEGRLDIVEESVLQTPRETGRGGKKRAKRFLFTVLVGASLVWISAFSYAKVESLREVGIYARVDGWVPIVLLAGGVIMMASLAGILLLLINPKK